MNRTVRNRAIAIVIAAVAILAAVRIGSIANVSLRSEAAETRMQLEAMENQDISAIQEEIDLKRSVMGFDAVDPGERNVEIEETAVVSDETN